MRIQLLTRETPERYAQENFKRLSNFINQEALMKGQFKFFTYEFESAESNLRIPHHLGFQPKDIIQTSLTGSGALTWNYSLFTVEFLDITVTGACVVRAFVGTYAEGA